MGANQLNEFKYGTVGLLHTILKRMHLYFLFLEKGRLQRLRLSSSGSFTVSFPPGSKKLCIPG